MGKAILIFFLLWQTVANGQALTIGDMFRDTVLGRAVNYGSPEIITADLKDKILLLDFWATWCGSCIGNMPKMAALQKAFPNDVQVILVTYEPMATVERFYARRPQLKALGLPVVTADSLMRKRFPCRAVPHVVWIGKDRQVKAITAAGYVTPQHLETLVSTNSIRLPVKRDVIDFDYEKPFNTQEDGSPVLLLGSKLTGYMEGVTDRDGFTRPADSTFRLFAVNCSLETLYLIAINDRLRLPAPVLQRRILLETRQQALFVMPDDAEAAKRLLLCYELVLPGKDSYALRQRMGIWMQQDLDRAFGLNSRVERRTMRCYVATPLAESGPKMNAPQRVEETDAGTVLEQVPGDILPAFIYQHFDTALPIVYQGAAAQAFNLVIPPTITNAAALTAVLRQGGLALEEKTMELDMLVISDKEEAAHPAR